MASIKYKTNEGYVSIPLNIIGSRVYLEDYDDGEVVPELVDDNAKLGNGIGTCSTSSGTALEVTLDNYKLVKNGIIAVTFENDVPANATLNINNKGAKAIYNEGSAIEADVIKAGKTVMFAYDGTNYVVTSLGGGGSNSEFVGIKLTEPDGEVDGLIGTTITITNEDTSETILSTTWQGDIIVAEIADGIEYTVTSGGATGYVIVNNSETHTAIGGFSLNIVFEYIASNGGVDLGLPSGLKWARTNIDASQANGFAVSEYQYECSFFSWGNIIGHNPISTSAFNYDFGSSNSGTYASTPGSQLSGSVPANSTYDIARAICGAPWRLPTATEFQELIDNCDFVQADGVTVVSDTNKLVTVNGIVGIYLRSKINGNHLFFPCSGLGSGTSWAGRTEYGVYWSSSINPSNSDKALDLHPKSTGVFPQYEHYRFLGFTGRPVM